MNDKDILVSHCIDIKKRANDNCMILNTGFLSVDEINTVKSIERIFNADIDTFYFGGYDDAERVMAFFVPKIFGINEFSEYFYENSDVMSLEMIRIRKDRFSSLSHRDYLGSIMGLGIKREMIGDIVITDSYTYVFINKSVSGYISENLTKAGRGTLVCEICDISQFEQGKDKTEIIFSSVASLRLDNIVSAAFNLSRNIALKEINSGMVYVNSSQTIKPDFLIREKDKIVLRGKGKVVMHEIIGKNKKGRVHINIKKYK